MRKMFYKKRIVWKQVVISKGKPWIPADYEGEFQQAKCELMRYRTYGYRVIFCDALLYSKDTYKKNAWSLPRNSIRVNENKFNQQA